MPIDTPFIEISFFVVHFPYNICQAAVTLLLERHIQAITRPPGSKGDCREGVKGACKSSLWAC